MEIYLIIIMTYLSLSITFLFIYIFKSKDETEKLKKENKIFKNRVESKLDNIEHCLIVIGKKF